MGEEASKQMKKAKQAVTPRRTKSQTKKEL
jgi:hypothetical protein